MSDTFTTTGVDGKIVTIPLWCSGWIHTADYHFEPRNEVREQIDATFARWRAERADAMRRRMRKEIHRPTRLGVTHRHE